MTSYPGYDELLAYVGRADSPSLTAFTRDRQENLAGWSRNEVAATAQELYQLWHGRFIQCARKERPEMNIARQRMTKTWGNIALLKQKLLETDMVYMAAGFDVLNAYAPTVSSMAARGAKRKHDQASSSSSSRTPRHRLLSDATTATASPVLQPSDPQPAVVDAATVNESVELADPDSWHSLDEHPRRSSRHVYRVDDFNEQENNEDPWVVNGINASEHFATFRRQSVKGATKQVNMSDARVLSLSHIFVVCEQQDLSATHRLDQCIHKAILAATDPKQNWVRLPKLARKWIMDLDEALASLPFSRPNNQLVRMARNLGIDLDDPDAVVVDEDRTMLECAESMIVAMVGQFSKWISNCMLETTFIKQYLLPLIENALSHDELHCRVGESCVANSDNLFADIVCYHEPMEGQRFDLLAVEVKPAISPGSNKGESDFVKVGKEMKEVVDALILAGVEHPQVVGLLVQGFSCFTYEMTLPADGTYVMLHLGKFSLPRSPSHIALLPNSFEHLWQLRGIMMDTVQRISTMIRSNGRHDQYHRRLAWTKSTCLRPDVVKGEK